MPFPTLARPLFPRFRSHPLAFLIIAFAVLGVVGAGLKYLEEDAQRQRVDSPRVNKGSTWLNTINPFLAAPSPTPTPQLSKEYIYAGSRLLAVEDANAIAAPPADLAVWRPSNGTWYVLGGTGSQQTTQAWGLSNDKPAPGDFDGDGKTDFSVFRPSDSKWYLLLSSDYSINVLQWGLSGDLPAAADFDGDGKTDRAVYRPNGASAGYGKWFVLQSSDGNWFTANWGLATDIPSAADFDGDGRADPTVWRNSNTNFYSLYSAHSSQQTVDFGSTITGEPVSGDYDGDGRADFAVRSGASWVVRSSATGSTSTTTPSGDLSSDIPVPNDYDGDGKCDIAVWRGSNGYWYIRQSASSFSTRTQQWGLTGDIPVPAYFRR